MNKITAFLLVLVMVLGFGLAATKGKAEEKNFIGVLPFVTNNGRVGFLDQKSGKIYIYDTNMSQCLFVGQIRALGKPIQAVSVTPTTDPHL